MQLFNAALLAKQINVGGTKIGYFKCHKGVLHPLLKSAVNQISLVHAFKYRAEIKKKSENLNEKCFCDE